MDNIIENAGVLDIKRLLNEINSVSGPEGLYDKLEEKTISMIRKTSRSPIYLYVTEVEENDGLAKALAGILISALNKDLHVELMWPSSNLVALIEKQITEINLADSPIQTNFRELSKGIVLNINKLKI